MFKSSVDTELHVMGVNENWILNDYVCECVLVKAVFFIHDARICHVNHTYKLLCSVTHLVATFGLRVARCVCF